MPGPLKKVAMRGSNRVDDFVEYIMGFRCQVSGVRCQPCHRLEKRPVESKRNSEIKNPKSAIILPVPFGKQSFNFAGFDQVRKPIIKYFL